jgi:hypothetical protein
MKKIILLLGLIFMKSMSYSQFTAFTPTIGLTLSNCKDFDNTKYKPGSLFGVSTLYMLSPKFAFKPELLIEQKGFQMKESYTDENGWLLGTGTAFYTWNYITLPLQIQYSLINSNNIFITAGGYAGYMLWGNKRTTGGTGDIKNEKSKLDIGNNNRFEVGFNAGGGINIPINGINKIEIEFRYERSFRDQNYRYPSATTTFSLSAGYTIDLRK